VIVLSAKRGSLMKKLRHIWELVKEAGNGWMEDKAMRMAAAVAYYCILSTAPLVVIAIAVAGWVFGQQAAQGQLVDQMRELIGKEGADAIQAMLVHAAHPATSIAATVIGSLVLLFGASSVFIELQDSLNTIWEVTAKPGRTLWTLVKDRFLSFAMILAIGFLLLVSLLISAALAAVVQITGMTNVGIIGHTLSFLVSFVVITLLFALIFKVLPDAKISWADVWIGSLGTALLFSLGKLLIGLYLGHSTIGSTFGAAGSLVVFVVWIYYSALILFFGAEFTKVYANRFGGRIEPTSNAVALTDTDRAHQGIPRADAVQAALQQQQRDGKTSGQPAR
jgi:membrane protein